MNDTAWGIIPAEKRALGTPRCSLGTEMPIRALIPGSIRPLYQNELMQKRGNLRTPRSGRDQVSGVEFPFTRIGFRNYLNVQ